MTDPDEFSLQLDSSYAQLVPEDADDFDLTMASWAG